MRDIKLVVFDLDGTLTDSSLDIADSMNSALISLGLPERPLQEYGRIVGSGAREAATRACPDDVTEDTIDAVLEGYKQTYPEKCLDRTLIYDGIYELIDELESRGILLGVLTNKTDQSARKVLDHYFPKKPFAAILGNRGDIPIKPAPDMGVWICETLGIPPESTLFLGDSDVDIHFAKAVGFLAVGAAWGFRGREELRRAGADAILDTPGEMLRLLDGNRE